MVHYANITQPQEPVAAQTAFGDWEILRFHGNLPFEPSGAESLVSSLRRAILSRAAEINGSTQPVSPAISGHDPDGKPTRDPHIAFVPLLDVGHPYSDGRIRGLGMVRPVTFSQDDEEFFQQILMMPEVDEDGVITDHPIAEFEWAGVGRCGITIETAQPSLRSLMPERYFSVAQSWATVLPYRFEGMRKRRFSTPGGERETLAMVGKSCARVGLPKPERVWTLYRSPIPGVRDIRDFPPDPYGRRYPRRHLLIRFPTPIRGPVLLGADRFRGFGLCLAVDDELTEA